MFNTTYIGLFDRSLLHVIKSGRISLKKCILVQYSDKFMHGIILNSIVLGRSQLYCIVNLLLCGYNTIQCYAYICRSIGQPSKNAVPKSHTPEQIRPYVNSIMRNGLKLPTCRFFLFFGIMERIRTGSDLPKKKWGSPSIQQQYSHTKLIQGSSTLLGLKITAGQRTMSSLIEAFTGQTFDLPVILTSQNWI